MACSCHGKSGENLQDRRMPPDSQCLMCAMKHIGMAMEAMHELSYERDNRDFAIAHIRLAMEHTKLQWRDVAVKMRDVAVGRGSSRSIRRGRRRSFCRRSDGSCRTTSAVTGRRSRICWTGAVRCPFHLLNIRSRWDRFATGWR